MEPAETPVSGSNGSTPALLHELRTDPGRATLENLFREIGKLEHVRALAIPPNLFDNVSAKVLLTYPPRSWRWATSSCAIWGRPP